MRVAILSSEAVPFAKTGGLADVAGALTKALHAEGADSFLITPLYDQVDRGLLSGTFIDDLEVEWRGKRPRIPVWISEALNAPTYLIDAPHYFARGKIYGDVDDFERFAFFAEPQLLYSAGSVRRRRWRTATIGPVVLRPLKCARVGSSKNSLRTPALFFPFTILLIRGSLTLRIFGGSGFLSTPPILC